MEQSSTRTLSPWPAGVRPWLLYAAYAAIIPWGAAVGLVLVSEPWRPGLLAWLLCGVLGVVSLGWRRRRMLLLVSCAVLLLAVSIVAVVLWLPTYSEGWGELESVEIGQIAKPWRVKITDPAELALLRTYAGRGSRHTMSKSGFGYEMWVHERGGRARHYYLHGPGWGPEPGGRIQPLFCPAQPPGQPLFGEWLRTVIVRGGHPDPWSREAWSRSH